MRQNEEKSLQQKIDYLRKFASERNWEHTLTDSKALINAVFVEAGELAEHYQWKSHEWVPESDEEKKAVMYEIVDVFNFLLRLAGQIEGLSLENCWQEKMKKLAEKYPIGVSHSVHIKNREDYRKSGKNKLYE